MPTSRNAKGLSSLSRWILHGLLFLLIAFALIFLLGELLRRRDYRQHFSDLRSTLVTFEEQHIETENGHDILAVRLTDDRGLAVDGYLKTPTGEIEPRLAFLILGGVRTGRKTIDYLDSIQGVVLLALDYPYAGKKSGLSIPEFLLALPSMREAIIRTVPAAMLGVDYLLQRPDVDPERIILAGGSFGAMFAPAVGATDKRIAGVVVLFGAGDIQSLIRLNLDYPAMISIPAGWLGAVLTAPVEPLAFVGEISPRPVFMLNGKNDPAMPERYSRLLHEAAREPKTVRWIDTGHVTISSTEFHQLVIAELTQWLEAEGLIASTISE